MRRCFCQNAWNIVCIHHFTKTKQNKIVHSFYDWLNKMRKSHGKYVFFFFWFAITAFYISYEGVYVVTIRHNDADLYFITFHWICFKNTFAQSNNQMEWESHQQILRTTTTTVNCSLVYVREWDFLSFFYFASYFDKENHLMFIHIV